MFGLETLDILIGLATVYLVFGMTCTAIVEALMVWLNVRSHNLEAAFKELFDGNLNADKKFIDEFYAHPLVQSLSQGKDGRPSYIPAEIVSQVVENLILADKNVSELKQALAQLPPNSRVKGVLEALFKQVNEQEQEFRHALETHFNHLMDRTSGWVKRRSHTFTLIVSIVLVLGANLDSVSLTNSLAANPNARLKLVEIAQQRVNETQEKISAAENENPDALQTALKANDTAKRSLAEATATLESANVQLGWHDYPKTFEGWLTKIAGLLVSIFAVSLGAPFWFDILQKFMQVRATGTSPREADKK
jgi:hypothetical protein